MNNIVKALYPVSPAFWIIFKETGCRLVLNVGGKLRAHDIYKYYKWLGIEPKFYAGLEGKCSIQLSYRRENINSYWR